MIDPKRVLLEVGKFGAMAFFPADPVIRLSICEQLCDMAYTIEQVSWVINRTIKLFPEKWPGIGEVRSVFCQRFKPKDGVEAFSSVYLDGIPSERDEQPAIAGTEAKQIAGTVEDPTFPTDSLSLLATARLNSPKVRLNSVKAATDADIEAIKAQQSANLAARK